MREHIDYEKHVSKGDIRLDGPVHRSEGGMPIGNGVMGSLIWTEPQSLKLQINRSDVFANGCETNSFPQRCTDYAYTCGYVDVDFPSFDKDIFTEKELKQHLSIYDGILTMETGDVTCRALAWHQNDVMLIHVEDRRKGAEGCIVRLRMMRPPVVNTRNHTAESSIAPTAEGDKGIVLCQEFTEDSFICSSALAIDVQDRSYRIIERSEQELALMLQPGPGSYTIIIGSAAAFKKAVESRDLVRAEMEKADASDFESVYADNKTFWKEYWQKGHLQMSSEDGKADIIGLNYTYYLYLMASCSRRGDYAPNYGGLIWSTKGDMRAWGGQYWWINMNHYYNWLFPANRMEILDPYFNMYHKMSRSLEIAAEQQWGSKGIYIPETTWFDGLEKLPEDLAEEMRDLYLLDRAWETRSRRFMDYAHYKHPQNARWNWKTYGRYVEGRWQYDERGHGCYGRVLHLLESGGKLGYKYWMRYEFSQDKEWLEKIGYRMIKGIAEFFRNFPNLKKDGEGIYHMYLINDSETIWGVTDGVGGMTALHLIFPAAIKASKVLGRDEDLRESWQEVYDHLAPLPVSSHPDAMGHTEPGQKSFFVRGLFPSDTTSDGPSSTPLVTDLCSLETAEIDRETFETGLNTFEKTNPNGFKQNGPQMASRSHETRVMANLGLKEELRHALYRQAICDMPQPGGAKTGDELYKVDKLYAFENRMTLVEGFNAIDAQGLGIMSGALHTALLQDGPGAPDREPVLRVFPSWPDEWDADFELLARGGFLVSAARKNGITQPVEILSQFGGKCRIRNPWPGDNITIRKNGAELPNTENSLIVIDTVKGDIITLCQ